LSFGTYIDSAFGSTSKSRRINHLPRGLWRATVRQIINKRIKEVKHNPDLIVSEPWNLSDVFYETRTTLSNLGYDVENLVDIREKIHNYIKEYCDKLRIKRHEIGIFPADRAILAFRGILYSVGFREIEQLAMLGTDIICVEKMGIIEKLGLYTKDFGIALLQSQGFMSEYGSMLVRTAKKYGANVAILTDFDDSGVLLGYQLEGVIRFGIDIDTIKEINEILSELNSEFRISIDLQEKKGAQNHWRQLKDLSEGWYKDKDDRQHYRIHDNEHREFYRDYLNKKIDNTNQTYIQFLQYRRIELDSILRAVKGQVFWRWLKNKILEKFPYRDYNRAIDMPTILTPTMIRFFECVKRFSNRSLRNKIRQERSNLEYVGDLINVNEKSDEISHNLSVGIYQDGRISLLDQQLDLIMKDPDHGGLFDE
jgi:hypothetical protein